jgi:hypothetical protein
MKISNIEQEKNIYIVTFIPNIIERFFGVKEKTKRYKDTWDTYTFGGGHVYITEKGKQLNNGNWIAERIDNWRRKF